MHALAPAYPLSQGAGTLYHPQLGQVRYTATEVSGDPDTQVAQVIDLMRGYAAADAGAPVIQTDAAAAAETGEPLADTWSYLRRHGRRGMQFVRDEVTAGPYDALQPVDRWQPVVETLIRPADQAALATPFGDCDDFAMYGAALLLARGVPCSFVTVAADGRDPSMYSHVYLVAYPNEGPYAGQRVPLDLSHGEYLGWEVANRYGKRAEWPVGRRSFFWIVGAVVAGALLVKAIHLGANR